MEVTLDIDGNALLRASATDSDTGMKWSMKVDGVCAVERTQVRREPTKPSAPKPHPVPKPYPVPEPQPIYVPQMTSTPKALAIVLLGVLVTLGLLRGIFWALS